MPACAQVAIEASLQSDYRLRGYSLSDGQPVAAISLGYDDPSGLYLGGTAIGAILHDDPEVLNVQANVGYALRVAPGLSVDAGVIHSRYFSGYGSSRNYHYTEAYVGLVTPNLSARIRYSPDYFRRDTPTIYAEIDAGFEPATDWLVSAHVGALEYLDWRPAYLPRRRYDWRIGASRQIGRLGLHADLTGRLQADHTAPYLPARVARPPSDGVAAVFTLTRAF